MGTRTPQRSIRDLSRRLIASCQTSANPPKGEALDVFEPLRVSMTLFAGAEGYSALLRRALALSREEAPLLKNVTLESDGRLKGLEEIATEAGNPGDEAIVAVLAHLITLLDTFIGSPLTLKLVREAWPGTYPDELFPTKGAAK